MPARSQKQYKYMQGVAHGTIKNSGLTPAQAAEYIRKNQGNLAPNKLPRISKMMKGN